MPSGRIAYNKKTVFAINKMCIRDSFTPAPVYLMFIYYYNAKGELMNNQFVENGQENIHQHFFTPENIKPTFDGQIEADDNDRCV